MPIGRPCAVAMEGTRHLALCGPAPNFPFRCQSFKLPDLLLQLDGVACGNDEVIHISQCINS